VAPIYFINPGFVEIKSSLDLVNHISTCQSKRKSGLERERERVFTQSTKLKINQTYIKEREDQKFDKGKDILRGNFMCRM
jgi:hypothetical protein